MTHQEALDLLPWYAAETLSDEERQAVSEHLDACPECTMELAHFQELRLADLELSTDIPPAPATMLMPGGGPTGGGPVGGGRMGPTPPGGGTFGGPEDRESVAGGPGGAGRFEDVVEPDTAGGPALP